MKQVSMLHSNTTVGREQVKKCKIKLLVQKLEATWNKIHDIANVSSSKEI